MAAALRSGLTHEGRSKARRPDVPPPAPAITTCPRARVRCKSEELFARTTRYPTMPACMHPACYYETMRCHASISETPLCGSPGTMVVLSCRSRWLRRIERNNTSSICSKAALGLLSNDTQCGAQILSFHCMHQHHINKMTVFTSTYMRRCEYERGAHVATDH